MSHFGKLWDIMGLYGRQEIGPNAGAPLRQVNAINGS
jgi:hypothetical protein